MNKVYWLEKFPELCQRSIFLAGPTAGEGKPSWRHEAVELLRQHGFDGHIFIPEPRGKDWPTDELHDAIVDWEVDGLNRADCILFWVPRNMETLPGLTTNIEYGEWFNSGKVVLGSPVNAARMGYMKYRGTLCNVPQSNNLEQTVALAIQKVGAGSVRQGGECQVPLHIWRTPSFQNWLISQKTAGNRLDGAREVWTFRVGPQKQFVFFWGLHVDMYIKAENRHKTNEVVLSRPDISTVVMYRRSRNIRDSIIVLIKEFRSPAATTDGYVHEVPGGSSFKPQSNVSEQAAHEVHEETGLTVDSSRVRFHSARQMVSTLSAHKAHVFSVEINDEELNYLKSQQGVVHGVEADTERTYVEITTLGQILDQQLVDWSMLGMILSVICS